MAEYIQKLSAVCVGCGKDAFFTKRITDCEDIELIGGEESYKPVCRKCFHEKKERKNSEKSDSPKSNKDIFEIEEIEKKY